MSENVFEDARVSGFTRAHFRFLFLACWLATQPTTHSGPEATVVKLKCWDTAGPESFRSVTRSCYRGAAEGSSSCPTSGSLLVYNFTSRRSFDNLRTWLANAHVSYILMGNKRDLCEGEDPKPRAVPTEVAEQFAKEEGLLFAEASARSGEGVEEAFVRAAQQVFK